MLQTRRAFLAGFLAAPAVAQAADTPPQGMTLTPTCGNATISQTEGPYFTPDTPLRRDFRPDASDGAAITIAGFVVTRDCQPVPNALIELWHCSHEGEYDNQGYRLRGHQFSDELGRWWFQTIVPGLYPGRTRHFHVKVQRPNGRVLTTQLYFPDEAANDGDRIFDPALVLTLTEAPDGAFGRYDFVVA